MNFSLKVTSGPGVGKSFVLKNECSLKFGRLDSNDYVLVGDTGISRQHFEISYENGKYWIKDLNSRNGTYLNRRAVLTSELNTGDEIRAGNTTMLVSIATSDPTREAIRQSGLEAKSKVEFRFSGDDTTITDVNLRLSRLTKDSVFSREFDKSYFDLPGKVLLVNDQNIDSNINQDTDFESVGQHAVLVFPQNIETLVAIRKEYFGRDSMIMLNHSCRRSKLVSMINDSFSKFSSPTILFDTIRALPSEAAVGLMNGIDLAICESSDNEACEVIHNFSHSSWLSNLRRRPNE